MKISYNWIKQFLEIDLPAEEVSTILTDLGLEVEGIEPFESVQGGLKGVVVGKVLTCEKHPNADRLKVTTVDIGEAAPIQIVCGASNVAVGLKVPVATIGTIIYAPDGTFEIKKGKIRGEESFGMLCGPGELGLAGDNSGLLLLDKKLEPGSLLSDIYEVESDVVFEIGLTPNRADAMSHFGVARDLRAGLLQQQKNVEIITPSVSDYRMYQKSVQLKLKVADTKLVSQYYCVAINDVKVKESPIWLQNRLKSIGINPKNNIVDITNYVMHEMGQPLHAFDADAFTDHQIDVKTLPTGTKLTTLDGIERTLHEEDLVICAKNTPLCIAGVMGGMDSGVTEETKNIVLESAYFNPISIRKTAKRHGISSDASYRFERGVDPELVEFALKRAALLIKQYAGGHISSTIEEVCVNKPEPRSILLNFKKLNRIIGEEIEKETIINILSSLDIKIKSLNDTGLGILVPTYRVDVEREIDVIEEILRVYGYNNVTFSKKVNATMFRASRKEDYRVQNIISEQLVAQGFYEMMANSLTNPSHHKVATDFKDNEGVSLLNPLSGDLAQLRQSLLFGCLESIAFNNNRKRNDIKFFEFGRSYHFINENRIEKKHLTLAVTGDQSKKSWNYTAEKTNFFSLKSHVNTVLNKLGITYDTLTTTSKAIFDEGLDINYKGDTLVSLGSIKSSILKYFGIKQDVFYADFNWDLILNLINLKVKFTDIPKFPEVKRDLSLLLDKTVQFDTIQELAFKAEKSLLKSVDLFDVYEGNNLPEGKKSYAVSFIIQNNTKTLEDDQIDKIMDTLTKKYIKELGAELR